MRRLLLAAGGAFLLMDLVTCRAPTDFGGSAAGRREISIGAALGQPVLLPYDSRELPRVAVAPSGYGRIRRAGADSGLVFQPSSRGFVRIAHIGGPDVWLALTTGNGYGPRIVGHHGIPSIAPPNSRAGLAATCAFGFSAVEVDVRFTADSVPVLLHDRDISTASDGSGEIDSLRLGDLAGLHFYRTPDGNGEPIQTLSEALGALRDCNLAELQLDVKSLAPFSTDSGWAYLTRMIASSGIPVSLGGPDPYALRRVAVIAPATRTILYAVEVSPATADLIRQSSIDEVAVDYSGYQISAAALTGLRGGGVEVGVYNLPTPLAANELTPFPDFIASDRNWQFRR